MVGPWSLIKKCGWLLLTRHRYITGTGGICTYLLGTRQHCRDSVTMFSDLKVVGYYFLITLFVVATQFRHRNFKIFRFISCHWSPVPLSRSYKIGVFVACPALVIYTLKTDPSCNLPFSGCRGGSSGSSGSLCSSSAVVGAARTGSRVWPRTGCPPPVRHITTIRSSAIHQQQRLKIVFCFFCREDKQVSSTTWQDNLIFCKKGQDTQALCKTGEVLHRTKIFGHLHDKSRTIDRKHSFKRQETACARQGKLWIIAGGSSITSLKLDRTLGSCVSQDTQVF